MKVRCCFGIQTALTALLTAVIGCSSDESRSGLGASDAEIVDGALDTHTTKAVGAIVNVRDSAEGRVVRSYCTGTLIAPKLVLTAKHCARDPATGMGFAIGPIAMTDFASGEGPERVVLAERCETEPTITSSG